MTSLAEVREVREVLLRLVDKHCGVGHNTRGQHPGWLLSRLERVAVSYSKDPPCALHQLERFIEQQPDELQRLIELVRVGETRFFRDPEQWQALAAAVPRLFSGLARIRALSAGCSTGEEAWSLAMLLAHVGPVPFRVWGVDRSQSALEKARSGSYPAESRQQLPAEFSRFVCEQHDRLSVVDELRPHVSFACLDLLNGPPAALRCELVVCKNVIIYLRPAVAADLLRTLGSLLAPGGVLVVARAELAAAKAAGFTAHTLRPGVSVLRGEG